MIWDHFVYFATVSVLLWAVGAFGAWRDHRKVALGATALGLLVFLTFIILLWMDMERPPLRTMGETRLWYSFFLPAAGIAVYTKWRYKWILTFSTVLSLVFVCINLFKPEIHSKSLMPALQSPWFAPHVMVYMFAYALMGAAFLMACYLLLIKRRSSQTEMDICDGLVTSGLAFMTIGILFGALWAQEAWGNYWAWDPKETWAAATWFGYLIYLHLRRNHTGHDKASLLLLIVCFILLQMCWWGINFLPSAQGASIHTYNA